MPNPIDDVSRVRQVLGREIKARRTRLGRNQKEMAESLAISKNYLSMIERGQKLPSYRRLSQIASYLGTAPSELLSQAELGQFGPEAEAILLLSKLRDALASPAIREALRRLMMEPGPSKSAN